jgi:hypothetical protein
VRGKGVKGKGNRTSIPLRSSRFAAVANVWFMLTPPQTAGFAGRNMEGETYCIETQVFVIP